MNKSQIRNKIIKIRKKKFDKNFKIDLVRFISFLKINKLNFTSIGGYYPSNYEIDDLNILDFLEKNNSAYIKILPELLEKSTKLEIMSAPFDIVFSHNDLLPANFIQNNNQIWLIDWEYAGFNTPLFDLGGLASNNEFTEKEEEGLLENYFEKKLSSELFIKYKAIKCASLLRETMWSMVSEITSNIDFDYKSYTADNLSKFNIAFNEEFKIN